MDVLKDVCDKILSKENDPLFLLYGFCGAALIGTILVFPMKGQEKYCQLRDKIKQKFATNIFVYNDQNVITIEKDLLNMINQVNTNI